MLFRRRFLAGIAAGRITVAFRRWDRPNVRPGTMMRTRAGIVVAVESVEIVDDEAVTEVDAAAAGYKSVAELFGDLDRHGTGSLYRVDLHLVGPDPRIALRQESDLDDQEVSELAARLDRMDQSRTTGPWTRRVLRLIRDAPGVRAPDLAARLGRETRPFKADVRRLKELGLTESLPVGYRLSPRGRALLDRLEAEAP